MDQRTSQSARDGEPAGPDCLVVMYHYVRSLRPKSPGGVVSLSPSGFEAQLDLLCVHREPVDWPTLCAWREGRGSIPSRSFLLTFDDGLADHAETVVPILDRRGLRGVFFVPTVVLAEERMLSAHAIHLLAAHVGWEAFGERLLTILRDESPDADWPGEVDRGKAERMYHYEPADRAHLKFMLTSVLPRALRNRVVDRLFEELVGSSVRWARHWYLRWEQLVGMERSGHTIGGHGHTHEPLPGLSEGDLHWDLRQCMATLNDGLGYDRRPFSFPYGRFSAKVIEACRDAGFVQAFTTERRFASVHDDGMQLPRVDTIDVESELKEPCLSTRA